MTDQHSHNAQSTAHQVINEEGTPVVDATTGAQDAGSSGGSSRGSAYIGGMPGMPGMPGMQIPDRFLNRKGKPSLWKMIGWRGALAIVVIIAILVTLAIVSAAFLLFAIPILVVAGLIGAVVRKVSGKGNGPGGSAGQGMTGNRVIVVRRQGSSR